jgi:hypothetical protein
VLTSCDPPGYFVLATSDGRFVGTLSRGTELVTHLPPGERTIVAWNETMEEATGGVIRLGSVPVLHADLREGATYAVRLMIGTWDEGGPVERDSWTGTTRTNRTWRCAMAVESATSAMEVAPPKEGEEEPVALVPDSSAGQAWLQAHPRELAAHVAAGEARFAAMRPNGRALATLGVEDIVAR